MVIIQGMIHTIENEREHNEANMNTMVRLKRKLELGEEKVSTTKLRNSFRNVLEDTQREESLIREALDTIIEIRNIRNERRLQVRPIAFNYFSHKIMRTA